MVYRFEDPTHRHRRDIADFLFHSCNDVVRYGILFAGIQALADHTFENKRQMKYIHYLRIPTHSSTWNFTFHACLTPPHSGCSWCKWHKHLMNCSHFDPRANPQLEPLHAGKKMTPEVWDLRSISVVPPKHMRSPFKARTRTSLTQSKWGHKLQSEDKICVLALWHITMICTLPIGEWRSVSHILTLFCICMLYTFVLTCVDAKIVLVWYTCAHFFTHHLHLCPYFKCRDT